MRAVAAVALMLLGTGAARAAAPGAAAVDTPQIFVARCLRAFEDLDLDRFTDCFADDATVFFPLPEPAQRYAGKAAVRAHFAEVFAHIRSGSRRTQPPFHDLQPEDLAVQTIGSDAAVATFHLRNSERIARRTLVLGRVHAPGASCICTLRTSRCDRSVQ